MHSRHKPVVCLLHGSTEQLEVVCAEPTKAATSLGQNALAQHNDTLVCIGSCLQSAQVKLSDSAYLNSSAKLNSRSSSMSPMVGLRWLLKAARVV